VGFAFNLCFYPDCNTDEAIAVTMLLDKAGKAWGTVNDLLHSSQGQHNLFKGKLETGDILLHEEQRRPGFKMAGRVEHFFQYSGDKVITAVVARDNWGDDTGGEPEIISGGPGEKHVKVKVTSQYMRGFNHTVYVYGKK